MKITDRRIKGYKDNEGIHFPFQKSLKHLQFTA